MLKDKEPERGSFDYLLEPIRPPTPGDVPVPGKRGWWKAAVQQEAIAPPPPPPERGGGPPRVVVNVEIVHRRQPEPKGTGYVTAIVIFTLLLGILLFGCAHAENWTSYQDSWITRYHGDEGSTATKYKLGFTTYFDATDKHGKAMHCRSYEQGWQTITECD